jgi:hypothetical protein
MTLASIRETSLITMTALIAGAVINVVVKRTIIILQTG